MKHENFKKIMLVYVLAILLFPVFTLNAQTTPPQTPVDYAVLAPLPGTTRNCTVTNSSGVTVPAQCTDLPTYLPNAFNLAIGIAVGLAFIMITFGGVLYATSDAINNKEDGKKYIQNALGGLLLVIGAYTILNTINPQILNFNLNIDRISPTQAPTITALADEQTIRQRLSGSQITVNANPCANGQTRGCTNLNGLPENAITGLIAVRTACNCALVITGGTEGGHVTHGQGRAIVDLRPSTGLNRYIWNNVNNPSEGYTRAMTVNGQRVNFTYETLGGNAGGTSTGGHWHVVIQ